MDAPRFASQLRRSLLCAALLGGSLVTVPSAAAQQSSEEWMERCLRDRDRREVHCEVREMRLPAGGELSVNARPNGGISVQGWDRDEVLVRARVRAQARSEEEARELASQVSVQTDGGRIRSQGPRSSGWDDDRRQWSVSYEVFVPRRTDLSLTSTNGGLRVESVEGELDLSTTNGGISLERVAGAVRGRTTNGGLDVRLSGDRWTGTGLDLETTNGGVTLTVPENYSARLETRTVNGGMEVDFPVTVQGRLGRRIEANLGSGGAPIRVETTNGRVRIRRG